MKTILVILAAVQLTTLVQCRPGVEFEKQRLIEIPQNTPRYQNSDQSAETRRILNEINRINIEYGYVKKVEPVSARFNPDSYFYPRPAYHPILQRYNNGVPLPPTIRQIDFRKGSKQMIYDQQFESHLHLPSSEQLRSFNDASIQTFFIPSTDDDLSFLAKNYKTIIEYAPKYMAYMDEGRSLSRDNKLIKDSMTREKETTVDSVKKIVNEMSENKSQNQSQENESKNSDLLNIIVVSQIEGENEKGEARATATEKTEPPPQSKTFLKSKPVMKLLSAISPKPVTKASDVSVEEADDVDEQGSFKGPFSSYFQNQKEQVVEALKQGGVIIQRLRVRNGGIAIAGPGGVATAGSGGTAIVGPGGIAFTHPRSLAIAGPGAQVVSVPESIDLQKLALRPNARELPLEGIVVATGPVVYFNPAKVV